MALRIETTMFGGNADYARYLDGTTYPVKTDRVGDVDLFDFQILPFESAFVRLIRGAYIRVRTNAFDPWFTGYITNEPQLTFLGSLAGQAKYGYIYQASSDEYLLNLKPVGIHPPFLNTTQGAIIKALVNQLDDAGLFTVTSVDAGQAVARYVVDPTKTFLTIVKEFTDAADYIFKCKDHTITFHRADTVPANILIDGHDKHFNPGKLTVTQTTDPIVNDCTVLGSIEPQDYINEYFIGDGFTAHYPLMSSVFGVDSTLFLDDDFSANTVDNTKWNVYDPATFLVLDSGFINCVGGSNNSSYDVSLQSLSLIPLEGKLSLTHGQYDFVSASDGVVCALWTGDLSSSFANCFYGLRASKSGAATLLQPLVNGFVDTTQTVTINYAHRYVLRTIISFQHMFRQHATYSWMADGTISSVGGGSDPTTATIQTYLTEIDPLTAAIISKTIFINRTVPVTAAWALYIPLASNDLHCSMSGVTVAARMQAALEIKPDGASISIPQIIGPNSMDALDGLAPVATITDSNNGAATASSLLGTPQYNPGAAILQFFKDTSLQTTTVPAVRSIITLQYRHAGSALARVMDQEAVIEESIAWGDNGVRSAIRTSLSPVPRTAYECELAAKSIVAENARPRYQGSYGQTYPFSFTGEPLAGSILLFANLPDQFPASLVAETITQVKMTMIAKSSIELFDVAMDFGPTDKLRQLLTNFATQSDIFTVSDTAEIPQSIDTIAVGLNFTVQPTQIDLTSFDASNYTYHVNIPPPSPGGFEIRYTNKGWGTLDGKNLVLRTTSQTFVVPRNQRGKSVYVKAYDGRNIWPYSNDFTLMPGATITGSLTNVYGRDQFGEYGPLNLLNGSASFQSTVRTDAAGPLAVAGFDISRPLGNYVNGAALGGFGGAVLPPDATIVGIYPVAVAHYTYVIGTTIVAVQYGTSVLSGGFGLGGTSLDTPSGVPFSGEYHHNDTFGVPLSIGTSLSALAGMEMSAVLTNSAFLNGMDARLTVTAAGFAIYYTTTTTAPHVSGTIPAPFTVPSGQSVAWALPTTGRTSAGGTGFASTNLAATGANVWSVYVKAPIGTTATFAVSVALDGGGTNTDSDFTKVVTGTGLWQLVTIPYIYGAAYPGYIVWGMSSTGPVQLASATVEAGNIRTGHYGTNGLPYGALSRYAAAIRVSLPGIPPAPTAKLVSLNAVPHLSDPAAVPVISNFVGIFGEIPVAGGGTVLLTAGQGAADGTSISLPAGYSTSNTLVWTTPGAGYSSGIQSSGVFASTCTAGVFSSSFQNRSNAFGFSSSTNWLAAAVSAGATVTRSTVGGVHYLSFTTLNGDDLCIAVGSVAAGGAVAVPTGFTAGDFQYIVGMAGTSTTGHGLQGVDFCHLDSGLALQARYNDNAGNTWTGSANVFGVFWKAGGGVSSSSVTGGTALAITTSVGNAITLIQATVSNSGTLGLPTGFYTATVLPTSAMNSFATAGSNVSHGWPKCQISGGAGFFGYEDGSGHNWDGGGNVFAIAALPYTPPIPPVIPPPTITGYSYSITLQFIDPVVMEDVWGYEIRASDNTVLYHSDLVDSQYTGQVTLSTDSRSVLYYLYSYNLLGEYSSTPNTASFSSTAPSTISNLRVDDPTQTLLWDFSGTLFSGSSYSVLVDTTGTFTSPTVQATTTTTSYPIPTSEFFADRFFRVTYPDPLGPSVPQTIEHTYAPAGVSGFGSGQAFPVEPPPTGSSSPVTPTGLPAAYVSLYDSLSLAVQ